MSTLPDQSTPQTEWDRSEGARFRSKAATTGLVALAPCVSSLDDAAHSRWQPSCR